MGAAKKLIDKKVLRDLVPINALSANHVDEISKKALIEDVRSGTHVFKRGERDYQTVYLLDGKIELLDESREVVATVMAGSEAARHPLAHKQPRQFSARAAGKVTVARVDSSLLDVLLTWDESAGYDVVEIDAQDDDDWMTRMLQSQAFLQLPPSNIHRLLMRLEAINAKAGDIIVQQGGEGDYFYIVKSGRLAVTRKASPRSKEVLLAELGEGACFGEEALVSDTMRNASVMMVTDGVLMRLSKNDFQELLCAPLVHEIDFEAAQKLVGNGAKWLDVRLPGEFENQAIKGSTNLPLSALRDQCSELDVDTDYIVCCDTGRRSAAGAFVLSQRGFTVHTLKNGLMDVPDEALAGKSDEQPANAANDADIIQFEADSRQTSTSTADQGGDATRAADDGVLIDKLAAAENNKLGLERQLAQLQSQLEEAGHRAAQADARQQENQSSIERLQHEIAALTDQSGEREQAMTQQLDAMEQDKRALQAEAGTLRDELSSKRLEAQAVDAEKESLQQELNRLQQTLSQIQESADGHDDALRLELEQMAARLTTEQQRGEKQVRELEQELNRVRDDYHQLGQRTSAVAGERDAATRELQALREQLADLQGELDNGQVERQQALDELQQKLDQRERAFETEQGESQALRQKLETLEHDRLQLERQLAAASEQVDTESSQSGELQARLEALEQQHQDLEAARREVDRQREALQEQLQQAQHQLARRQAEATEEKANLQQQVEQLQQQLEQTGDEIGAERDALAKRVDQLQQEQQALEQERDALGVEKQDQAQQLQQLQQTLEEQQQQSQQQQSQQQALEQQLAEMQQQLEEKTGQQQQLQAELERDEESTRELQQQAAQAGERAATLEAELDQARQQHEALQQRNAELDGRLAELVKEHESDLASTRKALSRAQSETENINREQSRLMASLRKAERDLESERLDHEAQVHRLHKELKDAAGESNAGLAAELEVLQGKLKEQARDRDDLEIKLGERSARLEDVQAEVEKLNQQLRQAQDSARQAEQQLLETNQAANEEMAVRMEAEEKAQLALRDELSSVIAERNRAQEQLTVQLQELDELRVALETARQEAAAREGADQAALAALQQERDAALEQNHSMQQEVDRLRAEAEVTRGLVDMQATPAGVDAGLREELEQARKNVDVAVRLRTQAEEKNTELLAEIGALQHELQASGRQPMGHIPSLDENDPHAAAVLSSDYPGDKADEPQATAVLVDDEGAPAAAPSSAAIPAVSSSGAGSLKGLFVGVLIGAVIAGAGMWWLSKQQQPTPTLPSSASLKAPKPLPSDTGAAAKAEKQPADTTLAQVRPDTAARPAASVGKPKMESTVATRPETRPGRATETDSSPAVAKPPARVPDFARGSSQAAATLATRSESAAAEADNDDNKAVVKAAAAPVTSPEVAAQQRPAPAKRQPVRTYSEPLADGGRSPTLVEFQADSFDMGSGSSSPNFDERPRHRVKLGGFAISKHEITFAEYDRFARATGRRLPSDAGWGRGQRPVINVRWQDALAYTQWLSEQTGHRYRLPSEAEWEFAARAGSDTRFWWGNDVGSARASCFDCGGQWSGAKTAPVGGFTASPYGVQDMAGNVMEWVQDCYRPDYTAAPADGSAVTGGDCGRRVVRGGGYDSPSESLRSAGRDAREADTRLDNLGFRVVKE